MTVQVRSAQDAGQSVKVWRQPKVSLETLKLINTYKINRNLANQDEAIAEAMKIAFQFIDGEQHDTREANV